VGAFLEEHLEVADTLLEAAVLRVGLAVEAVAVPQLPDASHHRAHPSLQRRQEGEEPPLKQRQVVSPVDLVADRGEVQEHEADDEEPAPSRVDGLGHQRRLSRD
jgi:hypothetical protein